MGAQLMAIAAEGQRQRYYVAPTEEHEKAADVSRALTTCQKQSSLSMPSVSASRAMACAHGLISSPTAS